MLRAAVAFTALLGSLVALPAVAGAAAFQSPGRNIGCVIDAKFVRCDIIKRDWTPPPKPRSCDLEWTNGLQVERRGRGRFTCASDTAAGSGPRLAYGSSITRGRMRCASSRAGMRCVNRRTGHGFFLSRQRARPF